MSQINTFLTHLNQLWQSNPKLRFVLQGVAIGFPFFIMGRNLFQNWQSLQQYNWDLDLMTAALSFFFLFTAFSLFPLSTRQVMRMLNYKLSYTTAFRAYFLSQLAKYLPGGVWIVPGRIVLLSQKGVSAAACGLGILIEIYVLIVTGLIVFIPYVIYKNNTSAWLVFLMGFSGISLLALLYQPLLSYLLNFIPWFRPVKVNAKFSDILYVVSIAAGFWVLIGTGFYCLVRSLEQINFELWIVLIGVYSMAWVTGFLVFITPGGLGVREGALALLLSAFLPLPVATLIALLARVWWSLAEIIYIGIATLYHTKENQRPLP